MTQEERNKELHRLAAKRYYEAHKDKCNESSRRWQEANKDKVKAARDKRREANPEYEVRQREKHREYYKEYSKARYHACPLKFKLQRLYKICPDLSKVENFELAFSDEFKGWTLHHNLENVGWSPEELMAMNLYIGVPHEMVEFMRESDHQKLHKSIR